MMIQNARYIEDRFSIRSGINVKDVSQILTYTLEMTLQWNKVLMEKIIRNEGTDIAIHICPWNEDDLEQYLKLDKQLSRIVLWVNDQMPPIQNTNQNVQIVHYKPVDYSERFVVATATGLARAIVSWNQPNKVEGQSFLGVFISNPSIANRIASRLDQKLEIADSA